ncbi:hypothetical protein [Schaalia hyovaginalis]|uniref:hypothetical protein n=1 Tax=Schaalia hyovaginalis TaxID=29316 RepID=UPI0026F361AB|nr:hypothetical protein [Schaalia hyovaginalis]
MAGPAKTDGREELCEALVKEGLLRGRSGGELDAEALALSPLLSAPLIREETGQGVTREQEETIVEARCFGVGEASDDLGVDRGPVLIEPDEHPPGGQGEEGIGVEGPPHPLVEGGGNRPALVIGIGRSGREADEERVAARLLDF